MSCLFDSLSNAVEGYDGAGLRSRICDFLDSEGQELIPGHGLLDLIRAEWPDCGSVQEYTARMRLCTSWGGAVEIRAFVLLFGMAVDVEVTEVGNTDRTIAFLAGPGSTRRCVLQWNGGHYEWKGWAAEEPNAQ